MDFFSELTTARHDRVCVRQRTVDSSSEHFDESNDAKVMGAREFT
jgi:hypothetical protein